MIRHVWSVLCERISVDQQTNLISYLTGIEKITSEKFPTAKMSLAFGSRWVKVGEKDQTLKFRLSIVKPNGEEKVVVPPQEQKINLDNHRANIILDGFVFEVQGRYFFRLEQYVNNKWITVSEVPVDLDLVKQKAVKSVKK